MGMPAITLAVNTFFYDPFSSTTINLPPFQAPWCIKLDLDADRFTLRLDFSAPPTSDECMVAATIYDQWLRRLFTVTLRRRQVACRTAVHRDLKCTLLPHRLMVHHEGSFYCEGSRLLPRDQHNQGLLQQPPRLEPVSALDLVEKLGGEELWREPRGRQAVKEESKTAKREGLVVIWMEKESRCLGTYQPFLGEE